MTPGELYGSHWLLAYEANVKGWLPSGRSGDHVNNDSNFGQLKAAGVSFYDPAQTVLPTTGEFSELSSLLRRIVPDYSDISDESLEEDDNSEPQV
jgi:hypothetical protein